MTPNLDNSKKQNTQEGQDSQYGLIQPAIKRGMEPAIKRGMSPMVFTKSKSKPESLPTDTKEKMEGSFGQDFSEVNIHTNSNSAEQLNAKAYTQGSDIHFAPGEFQPQSEEGEKLIGHELTHVVQQKENKVQPGDVNGKGITINADPALEKEADEMGGKASKGETINSVSNTGSGIQRAVIETATDYRDFISLSSMTLSELDEYAKKQADWHASTKISDAERDNIRATLMFGRDPEILSGCGDMKVSDLQAQIALHGLADLQYYLTVYSKSVSAQDPFEMRQLADVAKAYETGKDLGKLKAAFPGFVLKTAMKEEGFYKLQANAYIDELISYYSTASPLFEAENGMDFESYNTMRKVDKVNPESYYAAPLKGNVRNFHRFQKNALDKLVVNFNDTSKTNPLTLILHTSLDHNGAFHRDSKLTEVIEDKTIHTIMIEGKETLDQIKGEIDPLAKKYGKDDTIDQVMIAGHGNARLMQLGGTVKDDGTGKLEEVDDMVSLGGNKKKTDELLQELLNHMDSHQSFLGAIWTSIFGNAPALQPHRRIIFNACLTNSNSVRAAITSGNKDDAKKEVIAYINNNASLATYMQNIANAGHKNVTAVGSNASFGSIGLIDPTTHNLDLTSTVDPKLTATKDVYVEFGTEPSGALRAVLETWAKDEAACINAMTNRVKIVSTDWDGVIIQTLYKIILAKYLSDGEKIRQMSMLADEIAEFKWNEECRPEKIHVMDTMGADLVLLLKALQGSSEWIARNYIPLVMFQAWMTADPGDIGVKSNFLSKLAASFTCQSARKFVGIDYLTSNGHMTALLATKSDGAMILALLGVLNGTMNADAKAYLISELNASNRFDPGKKVNDKLAGLATEDQILIKIGKLSPPNKTGSGSGSTAANENANVRLVSDTKNENEEHVTSVTYKGEIIATPEAEVYSDASATNSAGKLPNKASVFILGSGTDVWAIEYLYKAVRGTAFVKKTDVKVL